MSSPPPARGLIVEPDAIAREALARALLRVPSRALVAREVATRDEASVAIARERFDVVVAAAQLDRSTGADLLAAVARVQPKAARILVASHGEVPTGAPTMARSLVQLVLWKPIVETEATRLFDGVIASPDPSSGAPRAAEPPTRRRPAAALRAELRRIDTEMRRLRVQLALGSISSAAYARLWEELARRKQAVEREELGATSSR